jgi:hypothetical protein
MRMPFAELPTNSARQDALVERLGVPRHSLQRRSLQNFNIPAIFTCNRQHGFGQSQAGCLNRLWVIPEVTGDLSPGRIVRVADCL